MNDLQTIRVILEAYGQLVGSNICYILLLLQACFFRGSTDGRNNTPNDLAKLVNGKGCGVDDALTTSILWGTCWLGLLWTRAELACIGHQHCALPDYIWSVRDIRRHKVRWR